MCISGRITAQDVDMLGGLLEQERSAVAIDLKDVLLVDREAVRLLAVHESNGAELRNCLTYIREWITRERADTDASDNVETNCELSELAKKDQVDCDH